MTDETKIEFSQKNADQCVFSEVDIRARARMSADSKLTYKDATRMVFMADELLHRAYLDGIPPLKINRGSK